MRQSWETMTSVSAGHINKNLGFSHVKSGNPDTSRYFVLSGRSAVVSDYTANFSQTKK